MAVLAAVVLLAAACGDDGGSADTASPDDTSSDDMSSDDATSDDANAEDSPLTGTTLDCAEIQAAVEAAGDFSAIDPTGGSDADDLEASFNQSRAALAALGESAPEIAGEVEQAIEGLDALGEIFAGLDWSTDFSTNPQAALELAGAMGDSDIQGMIGAMSAISAWISTSCTS
jgi:hypothetical protein